MSVSYGELHIMLLRMYKGTKWQKEHTIALIKWFVHKNVPVQTSKFLNISVHVQSKQIDNASVGMCEVVRDREGSDPWFIRVTVVSGVGTSKYQYLARLAHEMVHVRQYVTRTLSENAGGTRYKCQHFSNEAIEEDYCGMPWETEAVGSEFPLVREYCLFMGIQPEVLPYSLVRRMA